MKRPRLRRALLFVLALIFIFEAWLFEVTGRLVSQIVAHVPIEKVRAWVTARIMNYSPWLTLTVFIIPALLLLPLKFIAVFLLAKGFVMGGVGMIVFAKMLGLGVTSFLFAVCKPKLMQLRFIKWLYEHLVRLNARAHAYVAPYMARVRAAVAELKAKLPHSTLRDKIRAARRKKSA